MLFKYEIHVFKLILNYIIICSLTPPLRLPFTFFTNFVNVQIKEFVFK